MTTNITPQQKKRLALKLKERLALRKKCNYNREALAMLGRNIRRENDLQKICDMKNEYAFAKDLIIEDEERLAALTNPSIANEVGITMMQLKYFDMATTNNWREQV